MKTHKKPLTAEKIVFVMKERQTKSKTELYNILLRTIKDFKKKRKPYYFISDNDVNNILSTLIKKSTE